MSDSAVCLARPTAASLAQGLRVTGRQMGYAAREAVARSRWKTVARIGYAIGRARRDRAPRLPIRFDGQMNSVCALGSPRLESKHLTDDLGGDAPVAKPLAEPSTHAETPAASQRLKIPTTGGAFPPSRRLLERLECRAAPALFDMLTEDGSRSAVTAVQRRE